MGEFHLSSGDLAMAAVTSISGAAGPRSAQISIANNDSDENPFLINLTGTAVLRQVIYCGFSLH